MLEYIQFDKHHPIYINGFCWYGQVKKDINARTRKKPTPYKDTSPYRIIYTHPPPFHSSLFTFLTSPSPPSPQPDPSQNPYHAYAPHPHYASSPPRSASPAEDSSPHYSHHSNHLSWLVFPGRGYRKGVGARYRPAVVGRRVWRVWWVLFLESC